MLGKTLREQGSTAGTSARNRTDSPTEFSCRLVASFAFEIARDDGGPVFIGQSAQLAVQPTAQLLVRTRRRRLRFRHDGHLLLPRSLLGIERPHSDGSLVGHAVEPIAD